MRKTNLVLGMLLIMLLAMSTSLMATDYVVSGAGTTSSNGTYVEDVEVNGKTSYKYEGATTYYLFYYNSNWIINTSTDVEEIEFTYYYVSSTADTPPSSGWNVGEMGDSPAPTIAEAVARLTYSSDTFHESSDNDGTISNSLTITYDTPGTDYFTGSNGTFATSKYSASNVPAGLTMVITKNSNLELSVSLTGTATNSNNANDISNLEIAFNNTAFNNADASAVSNSTKSDLNVNFIQQYEVASSGGDFSTIAAAITGVDDGDIINVAAETFTEAELVISKDLTIQGQGANVTIVQANAIQNTATYGVFQIESGKTVSISEVKIRHGKAQCGGGINNAGTLILSGSIVCNNNADDSNYEHSGGGIYNSGTLTINNCTINDNSTLSSSAASGYGGGINIGCNTTITNSTINNNSSLLGSGIYCTGSSTTMTITNSTITANNNKTATTGGGISKYSGNITLTNCTVTNNSGGIFVNFGTLEIRNTILADNGTSDYHVAYGVTLNDNGYNIVENQTTEGNPSNWYFNQSTDILYSHDYLGNAEGIWNRNNASISGSLNLSSTLADNNTLNGTQTLKTTTGSFAIDNGTDTGAPSTDQRGAGRNGTTDIGAYEYWDDDASLPVELSSFTATAGDGEVALRWSTESEIENLGFNIYRSLFGNRDYRQINGELIFGAGNSSTRHEYEYVDKDLTNGIKYWYKLEDVDYSGNTELHGPISATPIKKAAPSEFCLYPNYPNPFNPITTISYDLPEDGFIDLSVYNMRGEKVTTLLKGNQEEGSYRLNWSGINRNGEIVSSGIYFLRIASGNYSTTNKMIFIR